MFISLCVFSITFADSAILIEEHLIIFALIILWYNFFTFKSVFVLSADTSLGMLVKVYFLSPGLILSGEYAKLKSFFHFSFENFSKIGAHISSVTPG